MLRVRSDQMEAFRPGIRASIPEHVQESLQRKGLRAEREPVGGDVVATDARGYRTRISFRPDGSPSGLTSPAGSCFGLEQDAEGRLAAIVYPGGERLEMARDAR